MYEKLPRVGFIGLGAMGLPMAKQLVEAGYEVCGFDLDSTNLDRAVASGVIAAGSNQHIGEQCELMILMLPNSDVVDAVLEEMLSAQSLRCTTVVDMSSSVPARSVGVSQRLADARITFIDAPVSGGVIRAQDGSLTIMIGGDPSDVAEVQPMLSVMGRCYYMGPLGTGHATKALNNLLSATHLLASNLATLAASKINIDPEAFLEVVNGSSGRSGSTQLKLPTYVLSRSFNSGFSADLMQKDVQIACGLLNELQMNSSIFDAVLHEWVELNSQLERGADHTEIVRPVEQVFGLELTVAAAEAGESND